MIGSRRCSTSARPNGHAVGSSAAGVSAVQTHQSHQPPHLINEIGGVTSRYARQDPPWARNRAQATIPLNQESRRQALQAIAMVSIPCRQTCVIRLRAIIRDPSRPPGASSNQWPDVSFCTFNIACLPCSAVDQPAHSTPLQPIDDKAVTAAHAMPLTTGSSTLAPHRVKGFVRFCPSRSLHGVPNILFKNYNRFMSRSASPTPAWAGCIWPRTK